MRRFQLTHLFDKLRRPKTPHSGNSPTPIQPPSPPLEELWPWPHIDRNIVKQRQTAVAFHEAGHAVVSRYFGIVVEQLSIRPRANSLGRVTTGPSPAFLRVKRYTALRKVADRLPNRPTRITADCKHPRRLFDCESSFHAELHVAVAGMVAEEIRFKTHSGGTSDRRTFHLLVSCWYGSASESVSGSFIALLRDRYSNACRDLLSKPETWVWVEAVAKAAVESENGVLSGDEIESLRPQWHPPPTPFAKAGYWKDPGNTSLRSSGSHRSCHRRRNPLA